MLAATTFGIWLTARLDPSEAVGCATVGARKSVLGSAHSPCANVQPFACRIDNRSRGANAPNLRSRTEIHVAIDAQRRTVAGKPERDLVTSWRQDHDV